MVQRFLSASLILGMTLCGPASARAAGAEAIDSEEHRPTEVQVTGTRTLPGGPGNPIPSITRADLERLYSDMGILISRPWKCEGQASRWLSESLKSIATIQAGTTRADLLKLFRPSDDRSNRFAQEFAYRADPGDAFIYVEVEFDRDPKSLPANSDDDRIARISGPFIRPVPRTPGQQAQALWVDEVLQRIQTIRPGMTRGQLLEVFAATQGLYARGYRNFVSRDCPFLRVEVTFEAVGPANSWGEGAMDRIIQISPPYLGLIHGD